MERAEFENLVREQWPRIQSLARRFASGADLADVCQDVVLVAWRLWYECLSPPRAIPSTVGRVEGPAGDLSH